MHLARKLDKRSRVKPNISFPSLKTNSLQYCESYTEASSCLIEEFQRKTIRYLTQPESFGYWKDGKFRRYTPDKLVQSIDEAFYYEEVKPYAKTLSKQFKRDFAFLQAMFDEVVGVPLRLNTAHSECSDKKIANLELLYPMREHLLSDSVLNAIHAIQWSPTPEVEEVEDSFRARGLSRLDAWASIAHGWFSYSNQTLLTRSSKLELNTHAV